MYLSQTIGTNIIDDLASGAEFIFVDAPTGIGKTQLILRTVLLYIQKMGGQILYLVSRTILESQLREKILDAALSDYSRSDETLDSITVWTYHRLAKLCVHQLLPHFDVIVCNEAHFFLTDSTYAIDEVALSYDWITQQKCPKILLSATIDSIFHYMKDHLKLSVDRVIHPNRMQINISGSKSAIRYHAEPDYSSLCVKYVTKNTEIVTLCEKNKKEKKKKSLIFVSSKETGEKILQELQAKKVRAIFLTADNKELEEQAKTIRTISEKSRFDSDVLIAPAVLDVGVSIKDPDVNQIFIRSYNSEEFLQMLGRLRVPTDAKYEGITLFIHKIRKQDVDRRLGQERTYLQILEKARHSQNLDHDIASNEIMFADNCNPGIYNASHLRRMLLRPLALHRHRELFKRYKGISNAMSDNPDAFLLLQLRWLGLEEDYDVVNYVANDVREEIRKEVFLNREISEAKK